MVGAPCAGCGYEFTEHDTVYFKPISFAVVLASTTTNIEITPLCQTCMRGHASMRIDMGEVIDITERLRKRKYGDAVEKFKGMGFPEDYNPGPDELVEPYECTDKIPGEVKKEMPEWLRRIVDGEKEEG